MSDILHDILDLRDLKVRLELERSVVNAVRGVSLRISPGETHGLVGESGSGKSMTALAIAGLSPPATRVDFNVLRIAGTDMAGATSRDWKLARRDLMGMVFQNPMRALNPRLTVGSQLREAIRVREPLSALETRRRSLKLLASVELARASDILRTYPHELSGGMAQRVVIALALARNPRLLIADEPTTALDVSVQAQILDLIDRLRVQQNLGVLLISHDLDVIRDRAHSVSVMYEGEIVEYGAAQSVTNRPGHAYTQRLLYSVPARLNDPACADPRPSIEGQPIIEARNVSRSFGAKGWQLFGRTSGKVAAVRNVFLQLNAGESLGIVGETGSGKTTLARLLLGLEKPDTGDILFDGQTVENLADKDRRRWREQVQFVFQDNAAALNPRLRVGESITEALRQRGMPVTERNERLDRVLSEIGLSASLASRLPSQLSGGQRQRVGLARALISDPKVIIADEPVSALDVSVQANILRLMNELRRNHGLSYLIISHDIGVIRHLCTRIAVFHRGECVEAGDINAVFDQPRHSYTRALLAAIPGQKHVGHHDDKDEWSAQT